MALRVKMTKDQLQSGRLIPNGWYSAVVVDIQEDTDKNGSQMIIPEVKVTGHPEFAGVPVRAWMSADWFGGGDAIRRFIEACTGKPYVPEQEVDLSAAKGVNLKFYNQQGTDKNGRPCNQVVDWAHKDKAV